MSESRKQIKAQIDQTNNHLYSELVKAKLYKTTLRTQHPLFMAFIFLAPAFATGWQMGSKKISMTSRLVDIGLVAASSQFKNQIRSIFL